MGVAGSVERGHQFRDVLRAARLHSDVDGGIAQQHAVVGAVVIRFDDVAPCAPRSRARRFRARPDGPADECAVAPGARLSPVRAR